MKILDVRGIKIGEGEPKVIVPIVGKNQEEILQRAELISRMKIHTVEWRADFYDDVLQADKVVQTAERLRGILNNIPILFTFRTKKEGGEKEISMEYYTRLNKSVAQSGYVDLIDVEVFSGDEIVIENINNIQGAGGLVVASNHDFFKTPEKEELVSRLRKMQDMNADILKIAVMPTNKEDVLTLLSATEEMYSKYADRPLITMSMGPMGVISRLSGEVFGSSMTFGAVGQVSAPGQIGVEELLSVLEILHNAL